VTPAAMPCRLPHTYRLAPCATHCCSSAAASRSLSCT
jgi:hypothetical protein